MGEHIEILDESGVPTGKIALKEEAHRNGWFHPTVHIWFYTADRKILLQKRASTKETFPDLWDVSVAGHVHAGETPIEGALREIREEIGLEAIPGDLEFFGRFKSEQSHPGGIVDREFHYAYLSRLHVSLASLQPQAEEVAGLQLMPLLRFAEEAWGMAAPEKYVPHNRTYYAAVIKEIKSRL
jgi:isopentenyl-diphosphate delta-isomerase